MFNNFLNIKKAITYKPNQSSTDLLRLDPEIAKLNIEDYSYKIRKVVLSDDHLLYPNNYVVGIIYSIYLWFMLFDNGTILRHSILMAFEDYGSSKSPNLHMAKDKKVEDCSDQAYLVKSSMVHETHAHYAQNFKVLKLILGDENGEFLKKKEVKSTDGGIAFVVFHEPFHLQDIDIFHLKNKTLKIITNSNLYIRISLHIFVSNHLV
ncbi:hypothetical protein CXB51_035388 [Gossypium anomalum]|uniref:Uncharacterized protein n=1 Tax=Gossypium anomalum TaxID=47600 RepID=A0A8J5XWZ8_9ROSI|nr:hypothetical protein CXB51_035388 [Gossypium anomalum]